MDEKGAGGCCFKNASMIDLAALESSSARRLVPAGDSPIGGGVDGGGGDTAASRGGGEGDSSGDAGIGQS